MAPSRVRTTYWGFVADETLSVDELLAERYQGSAQRQVTLPVGSSHKRTLFRLLEAERIGAGLSESCAMTPAASVSGLLPHRRRAISASG